MNIIATAFETFLPAGLAAGLAAAAAWLMKRILIGLLIGIGRVLSGTFHWVLNAIKWKIGWY